MMTLKDRYDRLAARVSPLLTTLLLHLDVEVQDADYEDLLQEGKLALYAALHYLPVEQDQGAAPLVWVSRHLLDEISALTQIQVAVWPESHIAEHLAQVQEDCPEAAGSTWATGFQPFTLPSDLLDADAA